MNEVNKMNSLINILMTEIGDVFVAHCNSLGYSVDEFVLEYRKAGFNLYPVTWTYKGDDQKGIGGYTPKEIKDCLQRLSMNFYFIGGVWIGGDLTKADFRVSFIEDAGLAYLKNLEKNPNFNLLGKIR